MFAYIWAPRRENLSLGIGEQHRRRPACASAQSDQHLHYSLFIPRHTLVARYYVIPFGVCPSVRPSIRPCSPFPIDNLSIYSRNFFKFCIHIVIGDEWYGIVNGQNPSIFNGVTALFRIGKMVSGLLFLYCS